MRIRSQGQAENPSARTHHYFNDVMCNRDCPRFFDQVGHQTTNASIGNSKHSEFQSHFLSVESFQKKISVKNI